MGTGREIEPGKKCGEGRGGVGFSPTSNHLDLLPPSAASGYSSPCPPASPWPSVVVPGPWPWSLLVWGIHISTEHNRGLLGGPNLER